MQSSIDALTQRPKRRLRKRLIAAVLVSVGLHVLLFSKLPDIPKERRFVTLKATLNEQNAQGHDREDSTGVSDQLLQPDTPPAIATAPAPPSPPQAVAAEPVTLTPPPPPPPPPAALADNAALALPPPPPPVPVRPPRPPQPLAPAPLPPMPQKPVTPTPVPVKPTNSSEAVVAQPKRELAGDTDVFGTPEEIEYHRILTAHLRARTPAYPPGLRGAIRLQVKIQYGSIITSVEVISNSGGDALEQWARTVILGMSPVPGVPKGVKQPYFFRPTIEIGD